MQYPDQFYIFLNNFSHTFPDQKIPQSPQTPHGGNQIMQQQTISQQQITAQNRTWQNSIPISNMPQNISQNLHLEQSNVIGQTNEVANPTATLSNNQKTSEKMRQDEG